MVCEHLASLEQELLVSGIREIFRGQAWSLNCREWVYFDCCLDRPFIRKRLHLGESVIDHEYLGTHDGQESGFVCILCHDGIMGVHQQYAPGKPVFK